MLASSALPPPATCLGGHLANAPLAEVCVCLPWQSSWVCSLAPVCLAGASSKQMVTPALLPGLGRFLLVLAQWTPPCREAQEHLSPSLQWLLRHQEPHGKRAGGLCLNRSCCGLSVPWTPAFPPPGPPYSLHRIGKAFPKFLMV